MTAKSVALTVVGGVVAGWLFGLVGTYVLLVYGPPDVIELFD